MTRFIQNILILTYSFNDFIDFDIREKGKVPVYQRYTELSRTSMKSNQVNLATLNLRKNHIETKDSFFNPLSTPSIEASFFDVAKTTSVMVNRPLVFPHAVYAMEVFLNSFEISHSREIYDLLALLGDLGGIHDVFVLIFGIFVFPWSQFSYNLKIFEKLYLVRTTDSTLVMQRVKTNSKKFKTLKTSIPQELESKAVLNEVELHHPVKISVWNAVKLFVLKQFAWICCYCSCSKSSTSTRARLLKLYDQG